MADFAWNKPTVGGSSGTWGTELNAALDVLVAHPGIKVVVDADAKAAYVPLLGQVILQADTGVLYKCTNATGPVWAEIGPAATADSTLTTKGDLLVYGSALSRLGVGTNGQVLTADSAQALGVKWAAGASGSGWGDVSQTPPASPSAYDDEFDDASIDADWVEVYTPSYQQTYTESHGVMSVLCKDRGVVCSALVRPFTGLTPPVTIETAFRMMTTESFQSAGLIFAEDDVYGSGSKKMITAMHGFTATGIQNLLLGEWTDYTTRNSLSEVGCGSGPKPLYYIRLIWVSANTFRVQISPDGITWIQPLADFAKACAPAFFGLAMTGSDGNGPDFVSTFEYFRVF